jgi:hypothetical protein
MNIKPKNTVLSPGESLRFTNGNGSGSVSYISQVERRLVYPNGSKITIQCKPRDKAFRGELGIHSVDSSFSTGSESTSINRIVYRESELHFRTEEDARRKFIEGIKIQSWAYNSDGIVVGYFNTPARHQTNLTVYKYFVNGAPFSRFGRSSGGEVSVEGIN